MNGPIQFYESIFEPASFVPLRTRAFSPTSNLFVHRSGVVGTICNAFSDFAIATFNSQENLVLNVFGSSSCDSAANLGLIPKSISKGYCPSVPDRLRYPRVISPRHPSQSRSLLPTKAFWTARFNVPTIVSIFGFPSAL